MRFRPQAPKAQDSSAFRKARTRANDYLNDPERLRGLVKDAQRKAERYKHGPLRNIWSSLNTGFRLIKAYANGSYRVIPWESISLLVAAVVYLWMPLDLIPDFIAGLGLLDDAALFGWVLKSISTDLEAFTAWEGEKKTNNQVESDSAKEP